jgi:hypothetical protein
MDYEPLKMSTTPKEIIKNEYQGNIDSHYINYSADTIW